MYQKSKHHPVLIDGRLVARTGDEGPDYCAISNTLDQVASQLKKGSSQWTPDGYIGSINAASDEQTFESPRPGGEDVAAMKFSIIGRRSDDTVTMKFSITGGTYLVEPLTPVHPHELVYSLEQGKEALHTLFYYNGMEYPLKDNVKLIVLIEKRNVVIEFTPDQLGFAIHR